MEQINQANQLAQNDGTWTGLAVVCIMLILTLTIIPKLKRKGE